MTPSVTRRAALLFLILLIHGLLMLNAARRLSPTWDEITYPAAGLVQWQTGAITLNTEHGFLSKLICALPLLALHPSVPFDDRSWNAKEEYRFGYQFTFHNKIPSLHLILLSRIPAIIFSILTGLLLFLWIESIWGTSGGVITLLCYTATPIFLSRASLALLDMPMYFFIVVALWTHSRWMETGRLPLAAYSGIATGLGLLCKLIALPLLPAFLFLALYSRGSTLPWKKRLVGFGVVVTVTAGTIALLYLPWKGAWPAAKHVVSNLFFFDHALPYYWHGRTIVSAPSLLSWFAVAVKSPLCLVLLGCLGYRIWATSRKAPVTLSHLGIFGLACLLAVLFFHHAVATAQFAPMYLAVAGLAGSLGSLWTKGSSKSKALIVLLLGLGWADALASHPNYLAYFNPAAGGSKAGYQWLADSDQEWGQALPELKSYLEQQGNATLLLAYSGAADPRAYGLDYTDVFCPALVQREYAGKMLDVGDAPVYLAIGTKILQTEASSFAWTQQNLKPKALISSCFFVYDITKNPEAFRWLGYLYLATHRAAHAQAAFKRAQILDPGNAADHEALSLLKGVK